MKITYILSTLKSSGPVNQLFNVIKPMLESNDFEISIITLSQECDKDSKFNDFKAIGVNIYCLNMSRLKGAFFLKSSIKQLITEISPDIVHSQGIRADMIMASIHSREFESHWVSTAHNFPYEDYIPKYGQFKGTLMAKSHIASLRKCNNLISCSKSLREKWLTLNVQSKAIQNGVRLPSEIPKFRNECQFISVGSLIPRKNMHYLINAFKTLNSDYHLSILGDGAEREILESSVMSTEHIKILGHVDNVHGYLSGKSIFVSSSTSEGLPNTVLEALSLGLTCYLSDIESHREIHELYPNSTHLFSLKDEGKSLTKLICSFEEHRNLESFNEAISNTKNVLSDVAMSKKYCEFYLRVVNKNG